MPQTGDENGNLTLTEIVLLNLVTQPHGTTSKHMTQPLNSYKVLNTFSLLSNTSTLLSTSKHPLTAAEAFSVITRISNIVKQSQLTWCVLHSQCPNLSAASL